ncbi:hypothetical protein [[Mycoplasma] gypis]|uniref:Uncharacterized protein n=1 Tax=[Mycoplasma] gypis TaxID=92404 RepID=A0ABZ2RMF1_9BACT|nr:hypothetical protein [[Mycoplasma] gypis]MBN0919127.1 hypothetical protein [[Mycoplasma] gypis]
MSQITEETYSKYYEDFKNNWDFNNSIENFDAINYTPAQKNVYNFIKKYYFLTQEKTNDTKALDIYEIPQNITHAFYVPLDNKVRSQLNRNYLEKINS